MNTRTIGKQGETKAAEYLVKKGFTILEKNWTVLGGEIDLICKDKDVLVFVEVKYSRTAKISPEEMLTPKKLKILRRSIDCYLARSFFGNCPNWRLDLVCVSYGYIRHYIGLVI